MEILTGLHKFTLLGFMFFLDGGEFIFQFFLKQFQNHIISTPIQQASGNRINTNEYLGPSFEATEELKRKTIVGKKKVSN